MTTQKQLPKVLIVEDHELARYGLAIALEEKGLFEIVGEAENGAQALEMVQQHQPDIILMDIGMPVMDGITATKQIKSHYPDIKILMLTSRKEEDEVYASLSAGADAYCMKDIKIERLCQVLEMVQEGALWIDPAIARLVMQAMPGNTPPEDIAPKASRKQYNTELTERENEVLQLIVDGKSNKEIAQALEVTTHTAKAHVCNIIQKLAVDDRTQVAVKALKEGLVQQN
jgi:DNA-binding NarL/FixJ family response regulator